MGLDPYPQPISNSQARECIYIKVSRLCITQEGESYMSW